MQPRLRLLPAVAFAVVALLGPAPARADKIDEDIKSFTDYLKTSPDAQGLRNHIAEIALKKDPRVADALAPLLKHKDEDVRIAVCENIGKQGNKAIVGSLMNIADGKDADEKPKLMAAALIGIGDADAKGQYKFLMKTAKKYVSMQQDIAAGAFKAAANHVTADTVDDFVGQLAVCDSNASGTSQAALNTRAAVKPVVIDLLNKMTGEKIGDSKVWQKWWSDHKKGWKPPTPGQTATKDPNASNTYEDSAYAFEVTRPNSRWTFRVNDDAKSELRLTIEAMEEGQRAAWVEVLAWGTKGKASKTADAIAAEQKDKLEPKFKELKEAIWDRKCTFGGQKGVEQILFGPHKEWDVIRMHNKFADKSEVLYAAYGIYKSGKTKSLEDDIESILSSFKIKKM